MFDNTMHKRMEFCWSLSTKQTILIELNSFRRENEMKTTKKPTKKKIVVYLSLLPDSRTLTLSSSFSIISTYRSTTVIDSVHIYITFCWLFSLLLADGKRMIWVFISLSVHIDRILIFDTNTMHINKHQFICFDFFLDA